MTEPMRQSTRATSAAEDRIKSVSPIISETLEPITHGPERQAYQILRFVFTVAPIAAGLDKFAGILVNWDNYLAPAIPRMLGIAPHTLMQAAGLVEIIAGIGVALKPRVFGYVVSAWLLGIVGNLVLTGQYYDIVLRDFGLCLSAFALARLSSRFEV